jgi:hypothetical protein
MTPTVPRRKHHHSPLLHHHVVVHLLLVLLLPLSGAKAAGGGSGDGLGNGCPLLPGSPGPCPTNATTISPEFYAFIAANFSVDVADMLARADLASCGSFGGYGRKSSTEKLTK